MKNKVNQPTSSAFWIYGTHAVWAALENPQRICHRIVCDKPSPALEGLIEQHRQGLRLEQAHKDFWMKTLGSFAVHQGVGVLVEPLPALALEDAVKDLTPTSLFLVLDQITDPHNFGAILRSAAAFGVAGIITTHRHTPQTFGTVAKTASGGLEKVPLFPVTNLARSLEYLKDSGVWCVALDEESSQNVGDLKPDAPYALVLGAEGKGLRRLTKAHCDFFVKIPTSAAFGTLNVSNASAVALYALRQHS